jgi:hypothetical protein
LGTFIFEGLTNFIFDVSPIGRGLIKWIRRNWHPPKISFEGRQFAGNGLGDMLYDFLKTSTSVLQLQLKGSRNCAFADVFPRILPCVRQASMSDAEVIRRSAICRDFLKPFQRSSDRSFITELARKHTKDRISDFDLRMIEPSAANDKYISNTRWGRRRSISISHRVITCTVRLPEARERPELRCTTIDGLNCSPDILFPPFVLRVFSV